MKTLLLPFLFIFTLSFGQVPNGNFNSGTTGWSITPATFSITAPSGYLQINQSGTFTDIFYLKSSSFPVSAGNFFVQYSYINARFDPMMGDQPMGNPAIRLKDSGGNIIADFTTVSGLCINESQHYGIAPTNTCTTNPIAVSVAGNYHLEFSGFSNYLHWYVLDNIITPSGVLATNGLSADKISISPNPVKAELLINNIQNITGVKIYDSEGRLLKSIKTNSKTVEVSSLMKGIYYLEIVTPTKNYKIKFIKE
ncbi:Por secretion system C-terminal sorting domain-containing protein [Kaistella chaponensis]|uniref:Por secretion system C-terminal sorting domain-containing protein n=1 Tax=Kaistella chaponensis TaxID=713588 RepID=A0A1N7M6J1_9FLAO|nr:T9SS type A sorting domain-containing protein [Kaistella chaponensis]SIS81708.1 Por secretion system C-terminal sorting domain-containing protein [Kaistella chaponensis]